MEPNYKRVRRALQNFSLEESLVHVWQYSRLISGGVPLPVTYNHVRAGRALQIERYIYPHHLDLLARELVMHADRSRKPAKLSISTWEGATTAFNAIKEYGDGVIDLKKDDLMLVLHRIAHQQFPQQNRLTSSKIGRHLNLYRHEPLRKVFEQTFGIEVDTYFILAMGVLGSTMQKVRLNTTTDFSILGADPSQSSKFFSRITAHVDVIDEKLREVQQLNSRWEYTLNALHFRPLIALDAANMERVYCPLPQALEARLIEGIFYDLQREGGKPFERALGTAVEELVGKMLHSLPNTYSFRKPDPIVIKKQPFDLCDWFVSDSVSHAYIECKAKRIALKGRVAATPDDLQAELQILADAVVQNYANMVRMSKDIHLADSTGARSFCIVVTLEDWFLFSQSATSTLDQLVAAGLERSGLPQGLQSVAPYLVLSAEAFQYCVEAMTTHSMADVLGSIENPKYKGWAFSTYLHRHFQKLGLQDVGGFHRDASELFEPFLASFRPGSTKG